MDPSPGEIRRNNFRLEMYRKFQRYRTGTGQSFTNIPLLPLQGTVPSVVVPRIGQGAYPWVKTGRDHLDLDLITDEKSVQPKYLEAYLAVNRLKDYFGRKYPELRYTRCLGWGGNGLAAAFDVIDVTGQKERAVVVKMLFSDNTDIMKREVRTLQFFEGSEHVVQLLYQGGKELLDDKREADGFVIVDAGDAGDGVESSEDDMEPKPNIFITEMLENGDLSNFLTTVRQHKERFPNAFLWRFCLCFTRMCIALGFPTTLLPDHKHGANPITETVPARFRNNPKRIVHFDFDPRNIFVGDVSPNGEHDMTPILKLGDFGHATEVQPGRDDMYYQRLRRYAKPGYFAPEQFCVDWDYITPDQNLVAGHQIAGNYGTHTNVWAMGYIMECLITLAYPAQPPKPTITNRMPPVGKREYYTYGAHLEQEVYSYVDRDLIYLVLRLQAHLPADRPSLHELEQYVTGMAAAKGSCGETDEELMRWLRKIMYDPPPSSREKFDIMPVIREAVYAEPANLPAGSQPGSAARQERRGRGRVSRRRVRWRQRGYGIYYRENLPRSQSRRNGQA